jgi:S1-C subfamily serine protease
MRSAAVSHRRRITLTVQFVLVCGLCSPATDLLAADRAEIVRRCKAATALVEVTDFGSGSAFCIRSDGFFITNHHVVREVQIGKSVKLVLNPGDQNEKTFQARVIQADAREDLALLKIDEAKGLPALTLRSTKDLFETMPLTAFGYPFGRFLSRDEDRYPAISVNTGRISALRMANGKLEAVQIDALVNPGNSGGPVVDDDGKVLGVVVSGIFRSGVSFAIPADKVKEFLARPALLPSKFDVPYAQRNKPMTVEVEVVAVEADSAPDTVLVEYSSEGRAAQTVKATRKGDRFTLQAAPFAGTKNATEGKLRCIAYTDDERHVAELPDSELRLGTAVFSLSELRSLQRRSDAWIVTTLAGQRLAGRLDKLPVARDDKAKAIDWATVQRVDIAAHDAAPREVKYEMRAQREGKTLSTLKGAWKLVGGPLRAKGKLYDPRDPEAPSVEWLEIEARIDSEVRLHLRPDGLMWEQVSGDEPGVPVGDQHQSMVNDEPWKYQWHKRRVDEKKEGIFSDLYRLKLPQSHWEIALLSLRDAQTGDVDKERGEIFADISDEGNFVLVLTDHAPGAGTFRVRVRRAPAMAGPATAPKKPTPEQAAQLREIDAKLSEASERVARTLAKIDYAEPKGKNDAGPQEFVWIDDEAPAGSRLDGNTPWEFVTKPYPVYSGEKSMRRLATDVSQHYFDKTDEPLTVGEGDRLFAYVYLDPSDRPKSIMLQFNDGSWDHRAFWGDDVIPIGMGDNAAHRPMGKLPKAGEWVRLEVPVEKVGLKPRAAIQGWAYTQHSGTVFWDKSGIVSRMHQPGQLFTSLVAWEAHERAQARSKLPEAVRDAIFVDAPRRTAQQSKLIREYFLQHAYAKTRSVFEPLQKEIAALTKQREDLDAEIPGGWSFAALAGKWTLQYANGAVREYLIDADGDVQFPTESRKVRLRHKKGNWLLDFGDGKLERVRFLSGQEIYVEHYNPAAMFASGDYDTWAVGRRRVKP